VRAEVRPSMDNEEKGEVPHKGAARRLSAAPKPTPLPWAQIVVLWLIMSSEFLAFFSVIPFAPFMVQSFNVVQDPKQVGYWVGFITATFSLAQVLSAYAWGVWADRFGRKPVIVSGLAFTAFFLVLFGFAESLWQASVTRFAAGLFNGNLGVVKCVLGEITDKSNQARAFALFGLATSAGMMLGPIVGGFLASPAEKYPALFGHPIWQRFPYLLPTGVVAAFILGCALLAMFVLEETLPSLRSRCRATIGRSANETEGEALLSSSASDASEEESTEGRKVAQQHGGAGKFATPLPPGAQIAVVCYGLVAFQYVVLDELFPLWSMQPQYGLGFETSQVGQAFSLKGLGLLLGTMLFPVLERKFDCRRVLMAAAVLSTVFLFMPDFAYMRNLPSHLLWAALAVMMLVYSTTGNVAFSSVMLVINNSVESARLGELNGVGQSFASLARGLGPLLCSVVFSWSLENDHFFPFDVHCAYFLASAAAALTGTLAGRLPTVAM